MSDALHEPMASNLIFEVSAPPPESRAFLAFVETKAFNLRRKGLRTPLDKPLPADPAIKDRTSIARFHLIDTSTFREIAVRYDELTGQPSVVAREKRRAAHMANLETIPLPIADLYASGAHTRTGGFWDSLPLCSWVHLEAALLPAEAGQLPIYLADPDMEDASAERLVLTRVREVSSELRGLLRDIFSLVHVADLGSYDGSDGPAGAPPSEPPLGPDPEPLSDFAVRSMRVTTAFSEYDAIYGAQNQSADRGYDTTQQPHDDKQPIRVHQAI